VAIARLFLLPNLLKMKNISSKTTRTAVLTRLSR
jgi:hypothetical protein